MHCPHQQYEECTYWESFSKYCSTYCCCSQAAMYNLCCTRRHHPLAGMSPDCIGPIGICETPRQIIAKAILFVTKGGLQEAADPKQLCAGQIASIKAAVYAMKSIFSSDDTEAILLVDTSNAFNSLNRQVALRNVCHLCPTLANIIHTGNLQNCLSAVE